MESASGYEPLDEGSIPSAYTKIKKLFDFYKKFCYNIYTKRKLIKN